MMRRREFITLLGGAAARRSAPARSRPNGCGRIDILLPAAADDAEYQARVGAFLACSNRTGSIGRNLRIDTVKP